MSEKAWECVYLAIAVSPFWFLANSWSDLDELLKTALGGLAVVVVETIRRKSSKNPDDG